jgi:hypothetical protein
MGAYPSFTELLPQIGEALTLTVWVRIPIQPPIRHALILIKRATWLACLPLYGTETAFVTGLI